jgi:hypothetical protein
MIRGRVGASFSVPVALLVSVDGLQIAVSTVVAKGETIKCLSGGL